MTDDELRRWRTSRHEAGHFVARWLTTGGPPEIVSIRPGEGYLGITVYGPQDPLTEFEPRDMVIEYPSAERGAIEARIIATLAGPIAGSFEYPPDASWPPPFGW